MYNHERPHDALGLQTPASRYSASPISYSQALPAIEYPAGDIVAVVKHNGEVHFQGHQLRVSSALLKLPIAFRADHAQDGCYDVYFCRQRFMQLDLNALKAAG